MTASERSEVNTVWEEESKTSPNETFIGFSGELLSEGAGHTGFPKSFVLAFVCFWQTPASQEGMPGEACLLWNLWAVLWVLLVICRADSCCLPCGCQWPSHHRCGHWSYSYLPQQRGEKSAASFLFTDTFSFTGIFFFKSFRFITSNTISRNFLGDWPSFKWGEKFKK